MRKICLHIILISYTLLMLKPVLPYLSDGINHIFFYTRHMATVHYENGKYHVHYETAKEAKKETPDKTSNSNSKKDNTGSEYLLIFSTADNASVDITGVSFTLAPTPSLPGSNLQDNYPPPRL